MSIITIDPAKLLEKNRAAKLSQLKTLLADSDYQCWKHADGALTDEEYAPIKAKRDTWRAAYNTIQTAKTQAEIDAVVIEE